MGETPSWCDEQNLVTAIIDNHFCQYVLKNIICHSLNSNSKCLEERSSKTIKKKIPNQRTNIYSRFEASRLCEKWTGDLFGKSGAVWGLLILEQTEKLEKNGQAWTLYRPF